MLSAPQGGQGAERGESPASITCPVSSLLMEQGKALSPCGIHFYADFLPMPLRGGGLT